MIAVIRGGGDLGSGIALRLRHSGFKVIVTEIAQPIVLRRTVAFANAIYENGMSVEDVNSRIAENISDIDLLLGEGIIPVVIDPDLSIVDQIGYDVLVDARMLKIFTEYTLHTKPMLIGIGPGFFANKNCHAAIETNRGHFLGRVIWDGSPEKNTGIPGKIDSLDFERVIRAPASGIINSGATLGKLIHKGDIIGYISNVPIIASIDGCLRGLMHDGIFVQKDTKIGDLDPRMNPYLIKFVSEKSLAIAGGVLEATLSYFQNIK
ncbi:MAG: molybdenum hydroxylase [Chloroflexi bacterium HGW-Chloroflexi-8]|jgi:xanthine dehydrogenase accessory factor|nr:MAG: molybdenum hydroxylase [Chloroflexi bacterium HGW-Chloroflexi-8]